MNADEYAAKMLKDGQYAKHTKAFAKSRWDSLKKPTWEGFYDGLKNILWSIFKLFFMYWLFAYKLLPTQGIEKTAIFLILIVIVLLINLSRRLA